MKRTLKITISSVAFATTFFALYSSKAIAQDGPPPPARAIAPDILPPGLDNPLPRRDEMEQLSITSDQRDKINSLLDSARSKSESARDQLKTLNDEVESLADTSDFDSTKADTIASNEVDLIGEVVGDAQATRANLIDTVLTSDQKATLASLEAKDASNHPKHSPSVDRMLEMLTNRLNLTSDQQASIKKILSSSISADSSLRDQLRSIWDTYFKTVASSGYSSNTFNASFDQLKPLLKTILVDSWKTHTEIWALLTDDQRTTFSQMHLDGPPHRPGDEGPVGHDDGGGSPDGGPADAPPSDATPPSYTN